MRSPSFLALLVALVACGPGAKPAPKLVTNGSGSAATSGGTTTTPPVAKVDETKTVLGLDASIKHGVLPNGFTYYVKTQKKPEKRVQLWLAVNAGSVLEEDNQRGMAHLLEHIAFEGTKRFPKHDIQDFIERSGMRFGADLNAYTSFDETVYQLMVPTDDPKTVDKGLDVLRDWSADITLDPKEVIEERKIIEEERRTRNSSGFRLLQQIIPVAYQGSKYAQRLPIGTTEVINGATADQLGKLYKAWYRPDLMAVVVVGDVDAAAVEQQVKAKFGTIPAAKDAPKRPEFPVETNVPPRMVVARDKEQALFSVSIDYQMPHRPLTTLADFRRLLTEQMFSRLVGERMAIISKRAKSSWTNAGVDVASNLRPVDELSLSATAKPGKVLDAAGDLVAELARVQQHGFSDEELEETRAAMLQGLQESVTDAENRDSRSVADEALRHFLTREAMAGPAAELEYAKAILPTIDNAQLQPIAKRIANTTGRVVTIQAPPKAEVPDQKAVDARLAEAAAKQMPAWEATDLTQPILAATPTPGKVVAEKALGSDVTQWTLSNGAVVYLKKTTFKNDEVILSAVSNGGTSLVPDAQFPQALFAANIVNTMGIGNYGPEELGKKLAGKKVEVTVAIDDEQERVAGTASPNDLEEMFQLVHAAFVEPHVDAAAFDAWKAQQLQVANLISANTQAKFVIGAFDALFDKHKRIPLPFPTAERIGAIKLDQAIAFYKQRMANAGDFGFTIVGAFDPAKLKPLVEKYVASLPAKKAARETVKDVGLRVHRGVLNKTIKAGEENKAMSMLVASLSQPWSFDSEADANVLQHVLDIELLAVLREKLGGTYSVSVSTRVGRMPPQVLTFVVFESDPARSAELQKQAWARLDELATKPVSDDTLAKVKQQIAKSHEEQLLENDFWQETLERVARYGDDLGKLVTVDRVTARVTADQVKKTAALFVGKTNRATIVQLPEK